MKDGVDLLEYARLYEDAAGFVFDSYWPGDLPGGTGRAFDWSRLAPAVQAKLPAPVILSGGLTADNVGEAIRARAALGRRRVERRGRARGRRQDAPGLEGRPANRGVHEGSAQCG